MGAFSTVAWLYFGLEKNIHINTYLTKCLDEIITMLLVV